MLQANDCKFDTNHLKPIRFTLVFHRLASPSGHFTTNFERRQLQASLWQFILKSKYETIQRYTFIDTCIETFTNGKFPHGHIRSIFYFWWAFEPNILRKGQIRARSASVNRDNYKECIEALTENHLLNNLFDTFVKKH